MIVLTHNNTCIGTKLLLYIIMHICYSPSHQKGVGGGVGNSVDSTCMHEAWCISKT